MPFWAVRLGGIARLKCVAAQKILFARYDFKVFYVRTIPRTAKMIYLHLWGNGAIYGFPKKAVNAPALLLIHNHSVSADV